jgi:DNA-binding GntR family transcriptional regulator
LPLVPYRRFQLWRQGRAAANQQDHEQVLAAILAGNGDEAHELLRRHNTIQGDVLAEYISMSEEMAS